MGPQGRDGAVTVCLNGWSLADHEGRAESMRLQRRAERLGRPARGSVSNSADIILKKLVKPVAFLTMGRFGGRVGMGWSAPGRAQAPEAASGGYGRAA